jgi:hypothetical protein
MSESESEVSETIPFIAVGAEELKNAEVFDDTKPVDCPHCGGQHPVVYSTDQRTGKESKLLAFYKCDATEQSYLYALAGKILRYNAKSNDKKTT